MRNRIPFRSVICLLQGIAALVAFPAQPAELPDLATLPRDLQTPPLLEGKPAPGRRVRQTTPGFEHTRVYHALYLPKNWTPTRSYPVIVEYAGNGNYTNRYGDMSRGTVEGSSLGYGLSAGSNYLWVCLPYVQKTGNALSNCITWWGDVGETLRYCTNTLRYICQEFGGDTNAVVLAGFSRGSIGCNYLGLHDDTVARLWRGFLCHSHYDGVRTNWPYAGADRDSALARLRRLNGRPQFISQEGSTRQTQAYLESTGIPGAFTFVDLPFRNHSDQWVLSDNPTRRAARQWLRSLGLP